MAEYFVYCNYKQKKAVIHEASCPECKPHAGTPTDYWSGPYNTVDRARNYSFGALKQDISGCPKCCPIGKIKNPLSMDSFIGKEYDK
ncbi:MAG: hypothetical protein A2W05_07955 [Candidatus Schekmanbacteria bacterium RBG_16_38_10]|uniref:Uncharacterized protein n=1 Tax=Candidatus Schekmanbacteria bacterium RBG_16_38_10 TaxID=1817879 RepID=A0A1F7RQE4_9BACT|nr:MAG: hypothetical protein A2W05_07955 [Candidatus Schekmanbacteria bacterium RBG_16_38_10]